MIASIQVQIKMKEACDTIFPYMQNELKNWDIYSKTMIDVNVKMMFINIVIT